MYVRNEEKIGFFSQHFPVYDRSILIAFNRGLGDIAYMCGYCMRDRVSE